MEWDDYLRQQAAMYRQLAEKAEDPYVKQELLELARGRQQHRGSPYGRVNRSASAKLILAKEEVLTVSKSA